MRTFGPIGACLALLVACTAAGDRSIVSPNAQIAPSGEDEDGIPDWWRYVPASGVRGPGAELPWRGPMSASATVQFRITCVRSRRELFFEYFPPIEEVSIEIARETGLDLIFAPPGVNGWDAKGHSMHGPSTANSVTGRLKLTPALLVEFESENLIFLYGENGPTNLTYGGRAAALRRVAMECAPRS